MVKLNDFQFVGTNFAENQIHNKLAEQYNLVEGFLQVWLNVLSNLNLNVWSAKGSTAHHQQICAVLVWCGDIKIKNVVMLNGACPGPSRQAWRPLCRQLQ